MISAFISKIIRSVDYKKLSHYVLSISGMSDVDTIIDESSKCLKDLLNYRLLALSLSKEDSFNLWVDPSFYSESIKSVLDNDKGVESGIVLNYINSYASEASLASDKSSVLSYNLDDSEYSIKLYLMPNKKFFSYCGDILDIIVETMKKAISNVMKINALKDAASLDPLTKCYNRREFEKQMDRIISNSHRYNKDLSILMFDIDYFKKVNDTYGHQAGDEVLKQIAGLVNGKMRKGDFLARYGGEEFIAILPETSKSKAVELADRLRKLIESQEIVSNGQTINITASFGVANLDQNSDRDTLVNEADSMLYKAKASGRNLVMPGIIKLYKSNHKQSANI